MDDVYGDRAPNVGGWFYTEQINYSALDVIKRLEVLFKLNDMPDLTIARSNSR